MTRNSFLLLFAVCSILALSSCEGDDDNFNNGGGENNEEVLTLSTPCKYDITLLDTAYAHDAADGVRTCTVGSGGSLNPNTGITSTIPGAGLIDIDLGYGFDISKGTLNYNATQADRPSNDAFAALFEEGDYSFSMEASDGFQLVFMDDNGIEWSSSKGDALSNSNWLKIEKSVSGLVGDSFFVSIRASYSCGVVNDDGEIRGCAGSFTMQFENL